MQQPLPPILDLKRNLKPDLNPDLEPELELELELELLPLLPKFANSL